MPRRKKTNNENLLHRAYRYRLYPNAKQEELILKTFGCARLIYNCLLFDKTEHYKQTKQSLKKEVTAYKAVYPFLSEVDSLALANAKLNLEAAFNGFFEKKSGYPKFHKKGQDDSYTTNNQISGKNASIEIVQHGIKLPKLGVVKIKQHRQIPLNATIKSCTISKTAGKYYISVLTETEYSPVKIDKQSISYDRVLGLDFSVPHFYVDSNGNTANYPKYYRQMQKKLAKAQRNLSKKKYKSKNYYKQLRKVQKIQAHIANQRLDFSHKLSRELVNNYDVICFEDLNLSNLKRTLRLGKSVSDDGFGLFRRLVEYKLKEKGGYFIKVDKWFPSTKTCSHCGYKNDTITLDTKEWVCPQCGKHHLRDENAAINLKEEGYRQLMAA